MYANATCATCGTRKNLKMRKSNGIAEWRCPEHLAGTVPLQIKRPGKEKSA